MRHADGLGREPGGPPEQLSEVLTVSSEFAASDGGVESGHELSSFLTKAGPLSHETYSSRGLRRPPIGTRLIETAGRLAKSNDCGPADTLATRRGRSVFAAERSPRRQQSQ